MEEFGGFDGELHREAGKDLVGVAVDDQADSVLRAEASLVAVEELLVADLRGRGLVLHDGCRIGALDVRERVGSALGADQKAVALRVVARALRSGVHPDESTVAVLAVTR